MYNLHSLYSTDEKLDYEKSHRVMFDSTAFNMMETIFKKKIGLNEMRQISDNSLVPMLLYENYYTELFKNKEKQDKKKYIEIIDDVSSGYLNGDFISPTYYTYAYDGNTKEITFTFTLAYPIEVADEILITGKFQEL